MNILIKSLQLRKLIPIITITAIAISITSATIYASLNSQLSFEPESSHLAGQLASVADSSASANNSVVFGEDPQANGCTIPTVGAGGYALPDLTGRANPCNTGPRYICPTTHVGNFSTTGDGQLIEGLCVEGELRINHNNVTVRDVKVTSSGLYGIDIGRDSPTCPTNTLIEYTEVDKSPAADIPWGAYQRCAGGQVFDHIKIHNVGRGMMIYGNVTITNSYVYAHRTTEEAHRSGISTHGGDNFTVTGNTVICANSNCSSSINMYSDYAPVTNYLLQDNLFAGGSICVRGGQTHTYPNDTHDIRILNNRFSTVYAPQCGTLQVLAQFDTAAPGNIRSGNVWHENGLPITGE